MTAEIIIVNRSALAFAADSAVTIRLGSRYKIYDSAEKLFEFSRSQPIALMLYNNVEFVGIPLDVLVRKYRNENGKDFESIKAAGTAFLNYLKDFPRSIEDEKAHLVQLLLPKFVAIRKSFSKLAEKAIKRMMSEGASDDNPKAALLGLIQGEIDAERASAHPKFLKGKSLEEFSARYRDVIDLASEKASLTFLKDADVGTKLVEYAFSLVRSKNKSPVFTGIVIGGFAKKDLFPTVVFCEIDGVYFDELKFVQGSIIDIDRRGHRAAIVPFAQQEMAERFIYGLDAKLEGDIKKFVKEAAQNIVDVKDGAFTDKEKGIIVDKLSGEFDQIIDRLKDSAEQNVIDIVNFMSKKELADMAHALVELTSKKRRFSAEQDTVGGPIDVAVITRNEGFIWIQRKHYFDTELNQNYLVRLEVAKNGDRPNVRAKKGKSSKTRAKTKA